MMLAYKLSLISILAKWTIIESPPSPPQLFIHLISSFLGSQRLAAISVHGGYLGVIRPF